jgi:glycosyltransferase involved in cell wall biosynthesis
MPSRLAVVLSHPVQYYSPWFRHLAARPELCVKVFYLWDFGVTETRDRTFGTSFKWDIPLLDGYESEFLQNRSKDPGTHHFRGLDNPAAAKAVADWKPDAVLLFGYAYATHLRLILSPRLAGIPFYFRGDSHELCPANGWKPKVSRGLRGLLFRRFTGFLAVGKANAGYFRASGVAGSKIHRVPHCVDNARFQAAAAQAEIDAAEWKRELGIPAGAGVVLFAGKFEDKKRPLDLLEAFLRSKAGDGSAHNGGLEASSSPAPPVLLFVGSGPLEAELRKRAGSELGRSIFFAPFQNQTAMPKVYAAGDLLVLPSHGRGETWGLAVNEAMNLGRAAIVSSHVGCGPDMIVSGKTGWVFPAGNVDALRACLSEALTDREVLRRKGAAARDHLTSFSYEVATRAVIIAIG